MRTIWSRLIALGFAIGCSAHTVGFVLLAAWNIKWYDPNYYPAWRHAVMAAVDLLIVSIALQRPSWLLYSLVAFLVEQQMVNGFHLENALVFAAIILLAYEKWVRRPVEIAG